jgi:hypothetical protein
MSNEIEVAPETASRAGTAPIDREPITSTPRRPRPVYGSRSHWTGPRIAALVVAALLVLISLALLAAGGTALWADRTQRNDGYATTGVHSFSTSGSALATEHTQLGAAGVGWLYSPGLLGKVRIRVTPMSPGRPLFVGIGRSTDVDRYLAGVNHTLISDFFANKVETVGGGSPRTEPRRQHFWVASASGRGTQTLVWHPARGMWTVVVMNGDGRPGIDVKADLGARFPALVWYAIGLLAAGAVFVAGGVVLVGGAIRRRRAGHANDST